MKTRWLSDKASGSLRLLLPTFEPKYTRGSISDKLSSAMIDHGIIQSKPNGIQSRVQQSDAFDVS